MDVDEKILDKIKKLMRLAQSPNENEAALALQRAQELMAQYDIAEAKLTLEDERRPGEAIGEQTIERNGKKNPWRGRLAHGCALLMDCRMYRGNHVNIVFVGKKTKIETATYMFQWIAREVDRMANRGWDEIWDTAHESQISWKNSFKLGMATRLQERMMDMVRERRNLDSAISKVDPSMGQALMVIDKDRQELAKYMDGLKLRAGKPTAAPKYRSAFEKGAQAGQDLDIEAGGKRGLPAPKKRVTS